jgi:hypothetical protein
MNQNQVLAWISGTGVLLFSCVFVISLLFNKPLEQSALGFIKQKTTEKLLIKVDQLTGIQADKPNLAQRLFLKKYQAEVPQLKADIGRAVELIGQGSSGGELSMAMQAEASIQAMELSSRLWQYEMVRESFGALSGLISQQYNQVWEALNRDIRIFSAVNAGSFGLVLVLSLWLRPMPRAVNFISWLLTFCTVVCIVVYLFGQNWFYTILFNQYYGTGYLSMLVFMFLYLLFRLSVELLPIGLSSRENTRIRRKRGC